jgi:hypothetical protein
LNHRKRLRIKYKNNPTKELPVTPGNKMTSYFRRMVGERMGFLAHYPSMADRLHTLVMAVVHPNPCVTNYANYNQESQSSSAGPFKNVDQDIRNGYICGRKKLDIGPNQE